MEQKHLLAATQAEGSITLPGSKSISNRTLLLAALSNNTTDIYDLLASDDTERMLDALKTLGVIITKTENAGNPVQNHWVIEGASGSFPNKHADLFLGN